MKTFKTFFSPDKAATFILYFSILVFIIAFNFSDHGGAGWFQQFMPYLGGKPLQDITFTDSLTGYAITGNYTFEHDSNYILKTTNSGDNWNIIYTEIGGYKNYSKISFLNQTTGYICGGQKLSGYLIKTTNSGINWYEVPGSAIAFEFEDISVLSEDTIWLADKNGLDGGIFRTTNGGLSWRRQLESSSGLEKIYMYNKDIGFAGSSYIFKTTNSGDNWNIIPGQNGYYDIHFIDSLTGWKSYDSMRMTTDGGYTWNRQYLPEGGNIKSFFSRMYNFVNLNSDTIWGSGGVMSYGTDNFRGFLYMSTNRGLNWQYQIPDTSFELPRFHFIDFINNKNGWSYTQILNRGIHTVSGGDTTFLSKINPGFEHFPKFLNLFQNFPNPFNPKTKINYELQITGDVLLRVFDIQGKELQILVNERKQLGKYETEFDGSNFSSGIYFYRIEVKSSRENFSETKRMVLVK